jgi:hypothetical protein
MTCSATASAYETMLVRTNGRRIWIRTDNGKAFLNAMFQGLVKREGIHFRSAESRA